MKPDNDNTPRLLSRQEAAGRKPEFVYFVVSEKQNAFKVGFRGSAPRIENLQTGNPDKLTLVREINGGRDVEAAIHRELSDYRIRGEWFRETQLLDTILWDILDATIESDREDRPLSAEEAKRATRKGVNCYRHMCKEAAA
ncbi:GIY-YIG nuclease family protein [Nitratireductor kimnyeongensis]|uniref:GIY-YIG nuclease family protein n=1 Tax=Nitratireductor kimnyeongensis TaxID=430679 RepID=A0ABW0T533_9HYPH|nr:GIY-YIG nuclease family protein [Nitratireductor kimnyeongensis]QZZ34532.1 GIY-YIG nuclease family protein [Nitratireductor kimnyeongensis]